MEIETLKDIYRAAKGKLPEHYSANTGLPKTDCMVNVKPLYQSKDRGKYLASLLALEKCGLILYRHDIRKACLTKAGIDAVAGVHRQEAAKKANKSEGK